MSLQSDSHDAAPIRSCLFDLGAIDQISTLTPAPVSRYRRPGLDTASPECAQCHGKKKKDKKRYKRKIKIKVDGRHHATVKWSDRD